MSYAIRYKGDGEGFEAYSGLVCDERGRIVPFEREAAETLVQRANEEKGRDAYEVVEYPRSEVAA